MAELASSELIISTKTGLVYDSCLTAHYCAWNENFTERPERIQGCYSRIQDLGLVSRCKHVPVRRANDDEVRLCHTDRHIELLRETQRMTAEELSNLSQSYDFIYFHKTVEENAHLAVGGAVDLMDHIMSGKLQNGMAFIRPPGHHAMADEFSGYCYFNNIAITARVALEKYKLERILIVDWDVHHGQGTQFDFYDDSRVVYFSIHRFEHGEEWPHLRESDYDFVGEGKGQGFNINVPLNEIGCDNSDYLAIMFNVLLPLAYEFQPELVLVSAGYDCAIGCPEGQMSVTPACFAHFVNLLKTLAGGRVVLLLEGGYCIRTLAESSALSLRALLGDPTPNIAPISGARKSVVESILNVIKVHRPLHPSLAFQDTLQEKEEANQSCQTCLQAQAQHATQFRTKHNRPDRFPLVQECFDEVSDIVQEKINQQIDQLERETVLRRPAHRSGFLYYQDCHDNSKNRSTWEEASSVLSLCYPIQVPVTHNETKSNMQVCVSSALDSVFDNTVGSCSLLPCMGACSEETSHNICQAFFDVLSVYVEKTHINRILVLNIALGEDAPFPLPSAFNGKEPCMLILSVGISPVDESTERCGRTQLIDVPLTRCQMKNGDLISVGIQLLLPVAYEFGPDLVVFCLGSPGKKTDDESRSDIGCVAHLLTMMGGLASGRVLLFVKPSAKEQDFGVALECISALLGEPLRILEPCLPQQSTIEMVKKLQNKLKSTWKTLQFKEKLWLPGPIEGECV